MVKINNNIQEKSAIKTQFDIVKLMDVYSEHKNYEIIEFNERTDSNTCFIYFSSNGLYFPDDDPTFEREIIQKNRFEWRKNIAVSARKAIFIRDITEQWYLTGISSRINTIEKLCNFLESETEGFDVVCVGSSAGGYAAALFGSLLKASHVFCFSGQFSISYILDIEATKIKNPTVVKYSGNSEYRKYYSIIDIIRDNKVPIFYFFPGKSSIDIYQNNLIKGIDNVYSFNFNSSRHGTNCYKVNFLDLFELDITALRELHRQYLSSSIQPWDFSIKVSGLGKTVKYLLWQLPLSILVKINKIIMSKTTFIF
jgi:hypothetical protein